MKALIEISKVIFSIYEKYMISWADEDEVVFVTAYEALTIHHLYNEYKEYMIGRTLAEYLKVKRIGATKQLNRKDRVALYKIVTYIINNKAMLEAWNKKTKVSRDEGTRFETRIYARQETYQD